jgi:putative membrane protein
MTSEPSALTSPPAGGAGGVEDAASERRVEIAERRLHPAYLVISLGRSIRSLIPLIAVGIWKAPGWVIALFAALIALRSLGEWWVRKYSVVDGSLRVVSGLFKRTQHTIGIGRITALDAERGVVQRLFRVWGLKVQTPGNNHRSSVHLACLSAGALEELRAALRPADHGRPVVDLGKSPAGSADPAAGGVRSGDSSGGGASGGGASDGRSSDGGASDGGASDGARAATAGSGSLKTGTTLAVLDTRTLLIAAITGTSVPLILAGAAATFGRARDLLPEKTFRRLTREVFVGGTTTALLLLAAAALAVLAGIALTSLRLARFTLIRDGDQLRISRGLLAQRSGTIPVDRVQAVRVVEGWWRRMLGYCALEVEVAGLSTTNDTERMLFPLVKVSAAPALVERALPELKWRPVSLTAVPARARRRYFTLPVLVASALTAGLVFLPGWGRYLAVVPLPLAFLIGWGQAADAAWSLDAGTVTFRWRRVLARHTLIARRRRVQLTEITMTPLQRRAALAGIRLSLSSRRKARLRHLESRDAMMLLHVIGRRERRGPADQAGAVVLPAGSSNRPPGRPAAPYRGR